MINYNEEIIKTRMIKWHPLKLSKDEFVAFKKMVRSLSYQGHDMIYLDQYANQYNWEDAKTRHIPIYICQWKCKGGFVKRLGHYVVKRKVMDSYYEVTARKIKTEDEK